jgi:hypothetical protein
MNWSQLIPTSAPPYRQESYPTRPYGLSSQREEEVLRIVDTHLPVVTSLPSIWPQRYRIIVNHERMLQHVERQLRLSPAELIPIYDFDTIRGLSPEAVIILGPGYAQSSALFGRLTEYLHYLLHLTAKGLLQVRVLKLPDIDYPRERTAMEIWRNSSL